MKRQKLGDSCRGPELRPPSPGGDGGLCVRAPGTSAAIYKTETRHEGEVPEGTYIFQRGKKRLNYIFQRHRHAEEYQQCLGPEAEMPKMRIGKINTVELSIVAFFFPLGLLKAREANTAAGKMDKTGMMERAFPSLLRFAAGVVFPHKAARA